VRVPRAVRVPGAVRAVRVPGVVRVPGAVRAVRVPRAVRAVRIANRTISDR